MADSAEQFELLVVGPDGKAVPHTAVEIRTNAKLTAEQIQRGQFLKTGPYGRLLKTDAGGRLVVMLPEKPNRFDDMPAGKYVLSVGFSEHQAGRLSSFRFSVPETSNAELGRPMDLGVLTLEHQ